MEELEVQICRCARHRALRLHPGIDAATDFLRKLFSLQQVFFFFFFFFFFFKVETLVELTLTVM